MVKPKKQWAGKSTNCQLPITLGSRLNPSSWKRQKIRKKCHVLLMSVKWDDALEIRWAASWN